MNATVDRDRVAKRAYELYEMRGKRPGFEMEDWLRAEHEVAEEGDGDGKSAKARTRQAATSPRRSKG